MAIFTKSPERVAVTRGAVLLDGPIPNWPFIIDPDMLDMSCPEFCILGFLVKAGALGVEVRRYADAVQALNLRLNKVWFTDADVWTYGFETHGSYEALRLEWLRAARKRGRDVSGAVRARPERCSRGCCTRIAQ